MDRATTADLMQRQKIRSTLLERRLDLGLSQARVAVRMGLSQSAVTKLEAGLREGPLSTWQRYARAVGCRLTIHIEQDPDGSRA